MTNNIWQRDEMEEKQNYEKTKRRRKQNDEEKMTKNEMKKETK